jgi:WD40 repeat protein/class 3 adenylate cyclase/tRNA A-37 threonylcarbamoyl transferase component Bud32
MRRGPAVPTLIKERYEVLETLGAGGEARVVKALDRQHGRFVALKIRPVREGQAREELLTEARILLQVPPHPALPLVREDFFEGEDYVVAMDWVDGTDLATLLRERGRPGLAPSSVLAYLSDAAQALTHLHSQDPAVIHGDVKPGNLILTKGGRITLVDFGLSSAPKARRRRAGTPGFRAPELASNPAPSRASDIYALAATAFALLTGSPPAGVLPAWEGIDPAQTEQLEAAIRLGLATDPSRRPATPGELIERLRAGWAEALPTGVITFCLSDIEDSTAMWDRDPAAMAEALVRHDELIADCVAAHGGRLIQSMGEGDSTVSVFDSAPSALDAALAATLALSAEQWPGDLHIAARFALHTGEAERRGTTYFGSSINLAARLRGQADGGQIFLSSVTSGLVDRHLPDGCSLVDLGPHRLKGLATPEPIHALKGPGVRAPLPATECPYRGLLAFEPEDRDYFFGREEVVAELVGRLAPGRLLAVVGASGSGKSSVLRAGVIAAVCAGEVPGIERACVLTPGSSPPLDIDDPVQLVVVDQFEELFTLCDDSDRRQAFIDALLAADGPVAVGVRADMYGKLAAHPALARAIAGNQLLLGAMNDEELERAVREPARLAGLRVEPGVVELAVREVAGEPGALPLLSHALRATWERRDGRTLTVEGYRDSGGVGAAVAQTADDVVGSMSAERRQLTRNVFLRLTELGEGMAETRRRVVIDELVPEGVSPEVIDALLERLAEARLVTLDKGTAEVAHEVLIREWPALRGWLEEDREGFRLQRQLGDAARLWEAGGREPSDLYRGTRLAAAVEWAEVHREDLNAGERGFVDASVDEADHERRAQLRTNHRLRGLLAGTVILLAVAVIAGVVALIQRNHAQAQALTSDAERVGAQALTDPALDHSLLLAVAAVRLQNRSATRSDLLAVLQHNPALIRLIRPFHGEIVAVQMSPDGRLLVVADTSGGIRFIDTAGWQARGAAVRLGRPVAPRAMSFSPDGRTLMVVTVQPAESTLYAIDVTSRRARRVQAWQGQVPAPPTGSDGVAYSPDGRWIAVSLITESPTDSNPSAERLVLLDASSRRSRWERRYPMRPGQAEPHVAFTPTGVLLTSAQQGDTILWNARTGGILRRFPTGGLPAISVDGRRVALGVNSPSPATASASVALLDLRSGRHRTLPSGLPSAWIRGIEFTPNGSKVVAGAFDGVHVWDVASGTITETYLGQPGPRSVVTLDPSGATVMSGYQDGSVAIFDLSGARRLGRAFRWNTPEQSCPTSPCIALNRQSGLLATDQGDGTIALVNLRTLRLTRTLPARDGAIASAVEFLPDGRTLVTGGVNRRVTFWNLSTDLVTRTLRLPDPVWWTAASPDGRLLAVQTQAAKSSASQVEVLEIATGKVLQTHIVRYGIGGVEFSHDGRELVALGCCASGSTVVAWDARSGRQLFIRAAGVHATAMDIAPDSRLLGVGTEDGHVLLLDARTGRQSQPPIQAAAANIEQVAYSPDGRSFAAAAVDGTTSLWDLRSRKRVGNPFPPSPGAIPDLAFEANGRLLIVGVSNAVEWPTDVRTWERFACDTAGRDLTRAEWHDLVPNRAYRPACPA